jgi:hypothetical protein
MPLLRRPRLPADIPATQHENGIVRKYFTQYLRVQAVLGRFLTPRGPKTESLE